MSRDRTPGRILDFRGRPPEVALVRPTLLIGEYPRTDDVGWLRREHGITAVLSLQHGDDLTDKGVSLDRLVEEYERHGIEFRRVPVADNDYDSLGAALGDAIETLRSLVDAGHTVFVHCNAGYNRSPTVAIAYLHVHGGLSLAAARDLVKRARACVPFMTLLESYFGDRR